MTAAADDEVLHKAALTVVPGPPPGPPPARPRYGPHDAICVLMAAGRKVAWRLEGHYTVDGRRVTVGQLNRLAGEIATRPFVPSALPVFKEDR